MPVHLYGGALPPGVDVGNHIGAVVVRLPLPLREGQGDPGDDDEHVAAVARAVGLRLRGGVSPAVAFAAAYATGAALPRSWVPTALQWTTRGVSVALTNVRGSHLLDTDLWSKLGLGPSTVDPTPRGASRLRIAEGA